ncbi:hypothetical protein D3C73_1222840 [compost metagenome]
MNTNYDHQCKTCPNESNCAQYDWAQQSLNTNTVTHKFLKRLFQSDEPLTSQIIGFYHANAIQIFLQTITYVDFGPHMPSSQLSLYTGSQYNKGNSDG